MPRPPKYKNEAERREAQLAQKSRSAIKKRREDRGLDPLIPYSGEAATGAKLTWKQVGEIRKLYRDGLILTDLAKRFRVSINAVSDIVNNRSWKE